VAVPVLFFILYFFLSSVHSGTKKKILTNVRMFKLFIERFIIWELSPVSHI
jgi:hypothetical protein